MKKNSWLKYGALSMSALMVFSLVGCGNTSGKPDGSDSDGDDQPDPVLTISQTELSLSVNETVQLTASANEGATVTWGSLDSAVATVDDGLVTGVAEGETVIWAETEALMVTCAVTVTAAPAETLELSQTSLSLEVSSSATLTASCSIAGATVKWSSSRTNIATVANGKVTALTKGDTVITATVDLPAGGKLSATCEVSVTTPAGSDKAGYSLVWCDEFNGTSLNTSKWGYQTGTKDKYENSPDFWGNDELQYYTQDAVSVSGGSLKITATKRNMDNGRTYSSGRILTRDKASWTYGYFEARMKTPTGDGMWPAFWMLPQPTNSNVGSGNEYGTWPLNGEIDIMEAKGRLNNQIDTTIHYGTYWPGNTYTTNVYTLKSGTTASEWHTYAVDWTADYIRWYVDGEQAFEVSNSNWWTDGSSSASAPFDKDFFILLNLAVGGRYDNYSKPDESSFTSATMEVDYVRVYKKS